MNALDKELLCDQSPILKHKSKKDSTALPSILSVINEQLGHTNTPKIAQQVNRNFYRRHQSTIPNLSINKPKLHIRIEHPTIFSDSNSISSSRDGSPTKPG